MISTGCGCSSMAEQKLPKLHALAVFRHSPLKTQRLSSDSASKFLKTKLPVSFTSRGRLA